MRRVRQRVKDIWSPGTLHSAVVEAAADSGVDDVWVDGVVSGVRRGRRFTNFELVEFDVQGMPYAMVSVLAPTRVADRRVREGRPALVRGQVGADPRYGRFRLEALDILAGEAKTPRQPGPAHDTGIQHRLAVPRRPRLVGLVTADGGAGGEDVHELLEGVRGLAVIDQPAAMSGPSAPEAIEQALRRLARRGVDLILLARGGGSRSDLAAFDHPVTVAAVAGCPVPVWTAVGHARDRSGADAVANASFATPSAAALELRRRVEAPPPLARAGESGRPARRAMSLALRTAVVAVLVLALLAVALR